SVDDHRRVEYLQIASRYFVAEDPAESRKIEIVAFGSADHQPDVRHEERQRQRQEGLHRRFKSARFLAADQRSNQISTDDTQDGTHGGANKSFESRAANS